MTDIVERLRTHFEGYADKGISSSTFDLMQEAAAEIERLREAHAFAIRVVDAMNGKKGRPARWSEPPEV